MIDDRDPFQQLSDNDRQEYERWLDHVNATAKCSCGFEAVHLGKYCHHCWSAFGDRDDTPVM